MLTNSALLSLLQLVSPALPVGAYSYSEGLETLVEAHKITDQATLQHWLSQELHYGAIRVEAAVLVRCYTAVVAHDDAQLVAWNRWLSAAREAEELRSQSWQMGRSLLRLLHDLYPQELAQLPIAALQQEGCNFATAFAIAAVLWQIDCPTAVLGYLHSWVANLIGAGVKLVPLGQTAGQQLLVNLQATLLQATDTILTLPDDALDSCGWGLAIASMRHETLYSRLFRS